MTLTILCIAATLIGLCRETDRSIPTPMRPVLGGEPALRQLAATGYQRSPSFRKLILGLEARRGFVILAWSPALPAPLRGALMDRVRVTPDGVVCLWVGFRPTRPDERFLPLLAHELQHALEALNSGPPDGASLEQFFSRIAVFRHASGYETSAALEIQARVQEELRGSH